MAVIPSILSPGVLADSSSAGVRWWQKMIPLSSASMQPHHETHVQHIFPVLENDMLEEADELAGSRVLGGAAEGSGPVCLGEKAAEGLFPIPEQWTWRRRCCALPSGIQGQDMWELLKAAPGEVSTRHEGTFHYQNSGHGLEQVSWRRSWCPKYWRDIWAVTLLTNLDFWSALETSGNCTRWLL